jgi:amidohydrolase
MTDARALAAAALPDAVAWRRHLHAHPELSFHEHETARWIAERLEGFGGLEILRPTATSVVATLHGARRGGRRIALRADIDALPIVEETGLEFASTSTGVMHACGHDGHTAVLLAVARGLAAQRDSLAGEIRFVFQHAEELPPGGAREVVASGALDGVEAVLGCHLMSTFESGKVSVSAGPVMAAADFFDATIEGVGGHGAFPHETVDPIAVAAEVVSSLQHVVSRTVDPLQSAVVSVTRIHAGSANNVIPSSVSFGGTLRCFDAGVRESLHERLHVLVEGIAAAHRAKGSVTIDPAFDPVVNDAALAGRVEASARRAAGDAAFHRIPPMMGGEDFSVYARVAPITYWFVGARNAAHGAEWPHHHPRFTIDEHAMQTAIAVMAQAALDELAAHV